MNRMRPTPLLVNEQWTREMGWQAPEQAVGQVVHFWGEDHLVAGVVEDFHYETVRKSILPLMLMPDMTYCRGLIIRLRGGDLDQQLASIQQSWDEIAVSQPFTYNFLDEKLALFYQSERKYSLIMGLASMLAILISCLGLFGLALYAAERRTKEIGIRKILGASTHQITLLLNKDFLWMVAISVLVVAPIAWLLADFWLENFAYRIEVAWWVLPIAGLLTITIAWLTVSYHAIKAALSNPVDALRYE